MILPTRLSYSIDEDRERTQEANSQNNGEGPVTLGGFGSHFLHEF